MSLVSRLNWLRTPSNQQVIQRWTLGPPRAAHAVDLPSPPDSGRVVLLALGDSGDSDPESARVSPQDAVARELALDLGAPVGPGDARAVLHTGDVVYMTGERRLYDRSFRRPYAPLLTPDSTIERLTFRVPFLPVPGNHDYYDFAGWAATIVRVPLIGRGLQLVARELFAFSTLPQGGSGMGRVYMEAFVDLTRKDGDPPRAYAPSEWTRLPNRYYRATLGPVDVFALDSNTLDAPPPGLDADALRADARRRERELQDRADAIDAELSAVSAALAQQRDAERRRAAADPARRADVIAAGREVETALEAEIRALHDAGGATGLASAAAAIDAARRRSVAARTALEAATGPAAAQSALDGLGRADATIRGALREVEGALARLPEGPARSALLAAGGAVERARERARMAREGEPPPVLAERSHALSEEALEVQRLLAFEGRRRGFVPADHDAAQLAWLDRALDASVRERPDAWRIVTLHHPPYTTLTSYCEHPELQGIRDNLLPLVRGRVHLVLGGHAHAFEWIRSSAAPDVAFVVTGGGGQLSLRRSVVEPGRVDRHRARYDRLRAAGVNECAVAGRGPAAADGEDGLLYHYVRIEAGPEALVVRPVGVRFARSGWRRESPMPAWHAASLPPDRAPWEARALAAVEIRRGAPPRPLWAGRS